MMTPQPQKNWYKKPHGKVIATLTLPAFAVWYIWTRVERNLPYKLAATAVVVLVSVASVSVAAAMLPSNQTKEALVQETDETSLVEQAQSEEESEQATQQEPSLLSTEQQSEAQPANNSSNTTINNQNNQPEQPKPQPSFLDTYPSKWASKPINYVIDDWGMNNRQSVSYTAWKVNEKYGNMSYFGGCNANQWVQCAGAKNIPTGAVAKVHSVGIVNNFSVWVEAVNGDKVTVSFYNWGNTGEYGLWKDVPASNFSTYIYFGDRQ